MTATTELSLSALMRQGSRVEHEEAENSSFMSRLLNGGVDAAGYTQYLLRYREVYRALEEVGAELADDPVAGVVVDPVINRSEALEADLTFWSGGRPVRLESPATTAYVERILNTRLDPKLFIAHHYTRYLGDLSGGQAIGRILSRHFDLVDGEGVHFYDFAAVPKPKLFKDAYRSRLDALDLSTRDKETIVDEVRQAFALNGAIFTELESKLFSAA